MGALNTAYTVLVVLVAVAGLLGTVWITDPLSETSGIAVKTASVVAALFVVALGVSLLV